VETSRSQAHPGSIRTHAFEPPREPTAADRGRAAPPLRRILIVADLSTIAIGWVASVAALRVVDASLPMLTVVRYGSLLCLVGVLLLFANGLYRRRICAIRSAEVARLGRTSLALAGVALLLLLGTGIERAGLAATVAALAWFGVLVLERGLLREWIHGRRADGDFGAPVVVVGGSEADAERASVFLTENPVLGFRVRDVLGLSSLRRPHPDLALGQPTGNLARRVELARATGAVLDASSLTGEELNDAVQELTSASLHVHISSGLRGVERRRITVSPLADETFLHVAPLALSRPQVVIKRLVDVVLASVALTILAPVLFVCALVIWGYDRGPVFYRQQRVGHGGELFTLYKLRTMVVGAEKRLAELQSGNGRTGPLFKLSHDPRVTPFGRFLRASSLDEVPQLCNVLEGTMSLVGPRPALPSEVAQFDARLNARLTVKPGVTGLWQVEARDLPSFDLYRRFDLLYVQNWSVALDLTVIGRTMMVVGMRAIRSLWPSRRGAEIAGQPPPLDLAEG
jgi:exopolysaccharide biosynthesis polyprenyl glycosylphosphotransferase